MVSLGNKIHTYWLLILFMTLVFSKHFFFIDNLIIL